MKNFPKNAGLWVFVAIMVISVLQLLMANQNQTNANTQEVTYSEFLKLAEDGAINSVTFEGNTLTALSSEGSVKTLAPNDSNLLETLKAKNVNIAVKQPEQPSMLTQMLLSWAPWLLFIGIWIYFMTRMGGGGAAGGKGGMNPFSMGKSRAQMTNGENVGVTFKDVAGVDEAKEDLEEIVDFLKSPERFERLGGRIPKGVLLVGSPGTGKTLLAKAVAGEAGVPFFSLSGSDFMEMFVGVGAARVRSLFDNAKVNSPCIIFIDEIDAIGKQRGDGMFGGHGEQEQTLNAMLVEMDGFGPRDNVIVIAATNRPDVLDPALLRPGRFDRQVMVPLPDIEGRAHILQVHLNKISAGKNVDKEVLAKGTPGFSGADLENLVNEAALMAARANKRLVDMADFEKAKDKIMMGAERASTNKAMSETQKNATAYHEAGHAIITRYIDGPADPLHKVTIIPRGRALGVTMSLPNEDRYSYDKAYLENEIAILMGGLVAEEQILNQQTTGASNDIERATSIAHRMVTEWGMSPLGPLNYSGQKGSSPFLGSRGTPATHFSANTQNKVDDEVRSLVENNLQRCHKLMKKHNKQLHLLAKALLEYETLDKAEIELVLKGKKLGRSPVERPKRPEEKAIESKKPKGEKMTEASASKAETKAKKPTKTKTPPRQ